MIRKAIVLAAGKGTRLYPLTLAMPKEMIRVGTKPVIEHVILVLKACGIKEILVIVGRNKEAIMNYLGSGERLGVSIYYRIQEKPKGSADAVYLGKDFVGSEDFIVMYGDNYFKPYDSIKNVVDNHMEKNADGTIVMYKVADPTRFGIVRINNDKKVEAIIEKPNIDEAKLFKRNSNYFAIAGLIILKSDVFNFIEKTESGVNDEVWLTDSLKLMIKYGYKIFGVPHKGVRFDIGTFEALKEADEMEQKNSSLFKK